LPNAEWCLFAMSLTPANPRMRTIRPVARGYRGVGGIPADFSIPTDRKDAGTRKRRVSLSYSLRPAFARVH
jgi:hypothetical protein